MRVVVTGVGVISALGGDEPTHHRALVAGARALAGRPPGARCPPGTPGGAPGLAAAAALAALQDAGGRPVAPSRVAVVVGSTAGALDRWLPWVRGCAAGMDEAEAAVRAAGARDFGRDAPARAVAAAVGARGPLLAPSVGCASGAAAIGLALDLLRAGRCDLAVAGGADARSPFVDAGFAAQRALDPEGARPFDVTRRGLSLGEGAGVLVLEREADARARGAVARAEVAGYGAASDARHLTAPDPEGAGCARAIAAALADARLSPDEIGFVNAHGTGTVFNDAMEARALARALPGCRPPVDSVKGAIGHTLGAAGAIEAALCARVVAEGIAPPTAGLRAPDPGLDLDLIVGAARALDARAALSLSAGFGGANAALLLRRLR